MTTYGLTTRRHPVPRALGWSDFDRLFADVFGGLGRPLAREAAPAPGRYRPRMDFQENDVEYTLAVEVPGVDEKDIEVTLEDDVLTVRGERAAEEKREGRGVVHVESFRGKFERSLRLPGAVDAEGVRAVTKNGVLTVTLPKTPEARDEVRSIPVTGGSAS